MEQFVLCYKEISKEIDHNTFVVVVGFFYISIGAKETVDYNLLKFNLNF